MKNHAHWLTTVILFCLTLLLAACGGGGGGGNGSGPRDEQNIPDTPNSYLPTSPDIRWIYNYSETAYFSEDKIRNGKHVHALLYPTGGKEYFVTTAEQVQLAGMYIPSIRTSNGGDYTADVYFDTPLALLDPTWVPSDKFHVSGTGVADILPGYKSTRFTYSGWVRYTGDSAATTSMKVFKCKDITIELTLKASIAGREIELPYNVTYRFSKNVGIMSRWQSPMSFAVTSLQGLDVDFDTRKTIHTLYASDDGIALTSFPESGHLQETVTVFDSLGLNTTSWSASSNQDWLSVTSNGFSGDELVLTADASTLAADTLYFAEVTISSSDAAVAESRGIRVALWVGAEEPSKFVTSSTINGGLVDPIRPYIYVREQDNTVKVYNIYNQALVATFPNKLPEFGNLQMSSDGSYLYCSNLNNREMLAIDLDNPANIKHWDSEVIDYRYARPAGHPVLISDTGHYTDALTGEHFDALVPYVRLNSSSNARVFDVSADGRHFCISFTYEHGCFEVDYVEEGGTNIIARPIDDTFLSSATYSQFILNDNASIVYFLDDKYVGNKITILNRDSMTTSIIEADRQLESIVVAPNGAVIGCSGSGQARDDFFVYSPDGELMESFTIADQTTDSGSCKVSLSGDGKLAIVDQFLFADYPQKSAFIRLE